jgi:hypothetical protein
MSTLRSHLTTLINQRQILVQPDLAYQFRKMVLQRLLAGNMLAFLIQFIGLKISTLDSALTPLWVASGTAAALIFLRGSRILPGIGLGSFAAYYFSNSGLLQALECASLLTLQAYALLRLCYRYVSPSLIFYQRKLFIIFMLFSTLITGIISYCLMLISYPFILSDLIQTALWLHWWLANLNGLIIFACAIMTWDAYFPQTYQIKKHLTSLVLFFGSMICLFFAFLLVHQIFSMLFLAMTLFLLIIKISMKFKWCGIIAALFIQGFILNIITFCTPTLISDNVLSVLYLKLFILFEIFFGLFAAQSTQIDFKKLTFDHGVS